MAQEIERKYIVKGEWKSLAESKTHIKQGYLAINADCSVRVRIRDERAYITIKGKSKDGGLSRYEFEKEILRSEAEELLALCSTPLIEKYRWLVPFKGHTFEVDEFQGDNEGLVMAEVELTKVDENCECPDFLVMEVTGDMRFYNSYLRLFPFKKWGEEFLLENELL